MKMRQMRHNCLGAAVTNTQQRGTVGTMTAAHLWYGKHLAALSPAEIGSSPIGVEFIAGQRAVLCLGRRQVW